MDLFFQFFQRYSTILKQFKIDFFLEILYSG